LGAWFFTHRLAVMLAAFAAALLSALLSQRALASGEMVLSPIWMLDGDPGTPRVTFVLSGLGCVAAGSLRIWAERVLGRAVYGQGETAGLVAVGPYARVRNPLYIGTWLFFFSAVVFWAPALVWLGLSALFAYALHRMVLHEETLLTASLGKPYETFLSTVPRWVPGRARPMGSAVPGPLLPALLGNLGFLSLGLYRIVVAAGVPQQVPGLVNLLCLTVWLGVLGVRRFRAPREARG
jgi:protein-S-isoprenylcysteine O-methyltransferase Ste14